MVKVLRECAAAHILEDNVEMASSRDPAAIASTDARVVQLREHTNLLDDLWNDLWNDLWHTATL